MSRASILLQLLQQGQTPFVTQKTRKMNDITRSRCEYLLRNNRLVNDWNTVVEQLLNQHPREVSKKFPKFPFSLKNLKIKLCKFHFDRYHSIKSSEKEEEKGEKSQGQR